MLWQNEGLTELIQMLPVIFWNKAGREVEATLEETRILLAVNNI